MVLYNVNYVFLYIGRDAVSDLAIHFLDKIKVMVVKDIEREDVEFVSKVIYFLYFSLDLCLFSMNLNSKHLVQE